MTQSRQGPAPSSPHCDELGCPHSPSRAPPRSGVLGEQVKAGQCGQDGHRQGWQGAHPEPPPPGSFLHQGPQSQSIPSWQPAQARLLALPRLHLPGGPQVPHLTGQSRSRLTAGKGLAGRVRPWAPGRAESSLRKVYHSVVHAKQVILMSMAVRTVRAAAWPWGHRQQLSSCGGIPRGSWGQSEPQSGGRKTVKESETLGPQVWRPEGLAWAGANRSIQHAHIQHRSTHTHRAQEHTHTQALGN